ncbi:uncharacterized protein PV07_03111 [Cladophialophora immunda]|uniref:Xylose isomerase-like TIM barrel domain-containing protein n=1 Tax=Cladophialophora immunda TaxID=569365 RepID=A0A0D2CJY1_9EURO|nr:uncharacterized protein PV07_03111 [Cladophialophora immunda]KIW31463.1 hypothetical protein PV07_03111 [Cladophialophora immunda]OQV08080.1 hypothetical protein CLAIMM_12404 [Cladophialophora immunda]
MMLDNKLAIASVSLGQHAKHTLPQKITAAVDAGFQGLEITCLDLETYADSQGLSMQDTARIIGALMRENKLHVLSFASFQNFEGNPSPIEGRLQKARDWLQLAHLLGAEHLQIPSIYQREFIDDHQLMVAELRQLAELAATFEPVIKVAYENLAWAKRCSLWQEAVAIVQEVDRDNFGLCLDTFHIALVLWADAYSSDGRQVDGDEKLRASMQEFVQRCPKDKLFYVQLSDGEPLDPPYSESHPWYDPTLEVGHVWSNQARPFPLETEYGAYMPVEEISRAFILDIAFTGWVSMETFDRRMEQEANGPVQNARRGKASWEKLRARMLQSCPTP